MESTESESKDRLFVTALARGLAVLAAFRGGEPQLSNQDLASRTGLPKSTVSRLTYTLTQLGYLDQDPASGRYQLGLAVLELSAATLASFDARRVIAPKMQQFAEAHGVSVSLAVREGLDMMYLETVRSRAGDGAAQAWARACRWPPRRLAAPTWPPCRRPSATR